MMKELQHSQLNAAFAAVVTWPCFLFLASASGSYVASAAIMVLCIQMNAVWQSSRHLNSLRIGLF
jgi:hypothetical protein